MEPVLTGLLQFGIGGAMAAAVLVLSWWNLTRTIPKLLDQREADLIWARARIAATEDRVATAEARFLDALEKQEQRHTEQLEQQQESFKSALESVGRKIESLTGAIACRKP